MTHPASNRTRQVLVTCLSLLLPLTLLALTHAAAQDKKKEAEKKEPPKLDVPAKTLKGHTDWVNSIAYSQDGKYLASGSRDRTVKIWDATGKDIHTLKTQPDKTKGVPGVKAVTFVGPG